MFIEMLTFIKESNLFTNICKHFRETPETVSNLAKSLDIYKQLIVKVS